MAKTDQNGIELIEYEPGQSVILRLPVPPSANRYWRHGNSRVYRSPEAAAYIDLLRWSCLAFDVRPLEGRIIYIAEYSIRKSRDLGNNSKVLQDALQGIAYDNDNQIDEIHEYRKPFRDGGSVFVTVTKI